MRNKYSFREPLGRDLNGLYITAAQMQFFLNRPSGEKKFVDGSDEFFDYFYKCAIYNIIWDQLDKDPACASIYWNEEEENLAVKFPKDGSVAKELKTKKISWFKEED
tara:strand:- start:237 stop:557 length:321 start_codon:yes stop_codon:yes gene_type:complete